MRILQTPVRLFATGGVESYVRNLSRELAGMGHDVGVICADRPGENEVDGRVRTMTLKSRGHIANTSITPSLPLALWREDFDILHTHLPTPWSADWSGLISQLKGRPLILTYHNDIVGEGWAGQVARIYNRTALRLLLRSAERIIVTRDRYVSPHLRDCSEKVFFIPLGIDIEAFRPQAVDIKGDIFFLSVLDEFHRYKGLEVLFAALKILKKRLPAVRLIVGGGGRLLDYYRQVAESIGIGDNVLFAGFIPTEKLVEYYNGCKLFVLPSTDPAREGFGIVPLEAMACRRPVVVTEIVGMSGDMKKHGAGMVVGPNDAQGLAASILTILEDDDLAERMGKEGMKLAREKYSWDRTAEQIERVYRKSL